MKNILIVFSFILFATGFVAVPHKIDAQVSRGGTLYVAVRTLDLKSSTGWFASNRGRLEYGDRVTVLQVSGRFVEVRSATNSTLTGWTPSANMSTRPLVSGTAGTATAREVALAGKGFNQEVEQSFRAQQNLNFDDVDRVEAMTMDLNNLRRFLEEGRLSMGE